VDAHGTGQRLVDAAEELHVAGVDGAVDVAVAAGGVADLLQRPAAGALGGGDRHHDTDGDADRREHGGETERPAGAEPAGRHDVGPV
jgi:hypothetical protein